MDFPIADLVSGGGTLALAVVIWVEQRAIRALLSKMTERLARIDERTAAEAPTPAPRIRRARTPARGHRVTPFTDKED